MKNEKINKFSAKISELLNREKFNCENKTKNLLENFEKINFEVFDNENPYTGDFKNKIFFTYSDNYRGNRGEHMTVQFLHNAHTDMDDRGYIKGVATDLNGYLILRTARNFNCNIIDIANIYFPKFKKSKHRDEYVNACNLVVNEKLQELSEFIDEQKKILNLFLKEKTGCSLLYYISDIN